MTSSYGNERPAAPTESPMSRPMPGAHIADPAPLGLAAFSLTTFVLSIMNTGLGDLWKAEGVVFGLTLAYGGIAQFAAGMWEFAKGNTFGATAFGSFGAFWLSFWWLTGHTDLSGASPDQGHNAIGVYLIAWAIFTAYMTVAATRVSGAILAVFVLLTITFAVLAIGEWTTSASDVGPVAMTKVGGWFGLATALVAWYASFAGVTAFTFKRQVFPVYPRA